MERQASRVLVVEDDPGVRRVLEEALRQDGYEVHAEPDGARIAEVVAQFRPHLAILDVRLPAGPDGYDIGRHLKSAGDLPLLFLTGAVTEKDRLAGFESGADDYVAKPFSTAELLARIRALLRRAGVMSSVRRVGNLTFDDDARTVALGGTVIQLRHTEYRLLSALSVHPGRVVSKVQLLGRVWGWENYDINLVEVHVSSLRHKLEQHGPRLIHTARGRGYFFWAEPVRPGQADGSDRQAPDA